MLKINMEMLDGCRDCFLSKYVPGYNSRKEGFICAVNRVSVTAECVTPGARNKNCPLEECDDKTPISNMSQEEDHINPPHYKAGGVECIDLMLRLYGREAAMEYCKLNGFKYMYRTDRKGGKEDIGKAAWYLKKYLELAEKEPNDDRNRVSRRGDMQI